MKEQKLPLFYGKNSQNEFVHISKATVDEKYVCEGCGSPLELRNREFKERQKVKYFAHLNTDKQSNFCNESTMHKLAKKILIENGQILIPPSKTIQIKISDIYKDEVDLKRFKYYEEEVVYEFTETSKLLDLVDIVEEKSLQEYNLNRRPDICATIKDSKKIILIEFKYKNPCSEEKKEEIKKKELICVEVDISQIETEEDLKTLIIENIEDKKWISQPEYRKKYFDIRQKADKLFEKELNQIALKSRVKVNNTKRDEAINCIDNEIKTLNSKLISLLDRKNNIIEAYESAYVEYNKSIYEKILVKEGEDIISFLKDNGFNGKLYSELNNDRIFINNAVDSLTEFKNRQITKKLEKSNTTAEDWFQYYNKNMQDNLFS